jgi:hypothetical protein
MFLKLSSVLEDRVKDAGPSVVSQYNYETGHTKGD